MEERSLTKMENGDMKRNKKKLDERRDLASRKNGKYLFGINDEPFLSLRGFLLLVKKVYLALYLTGNCSCVRPILTSSPLI